MTTSPPAAQAPPPAELDDRFGELSPCQEPAYVSPFVPSGEAFPLHRLDMAEVRRRLTEASFLVGKLHGRLPTERLVLSGVEDRTVSFAPEDIAAKVAADLQSAAAALEQQVLAMRGFRP